MKQGKKLFAVVFPVAAMLTLILDSKTALSAVSEGITLCLQTVIPSLFPFFFLASLLNAHMVGRSYPFFRPLGKLCRIPDGSEVLFLIGAVGGYPVGARSIREAFDSGAISREEAERMLGFCNNAGPAFLFGISGALFDTPLIPAILYGILIVSSVLTGIFLPGGSVRHCTIPGRSAGNPLKNAINAIATVCGWVVLFRIMLTFLNKWIFWILPESLFALFSGILELTNGCIALISIDNAGLRFILLCVLMSFGGLCVGTQTVTVTDQLSCKYYFLGKGIQSYLSLSLSLLIGALLFPGNIPSAYCILVLLPIPAALLLRNFKNNTGNYRVHGV